MKKHSLINALSTQFALHADAEVSARKSAYMLHKFSFYGIWQPQRNLLQKQLFAAHPITTYDELQATIKALWALEQREYHYTATDLLVRYKKLWTPATIDLLAHCITTKSWWDTIDDLAANGVGTFYTLYPELIDMMDEWIVSDNMWLRRTALIFQLRYKQKTDFERLSRYCIATMHEKEFFIRKAIGWALREYSKTNRDAVAQFVATHSAKLSPLSKREASKYI